MKKQTKVPPDKHGNIMLMVRSHKRFDRKLRQRNRRKK